MLLLASSTSGEAQPRHERRVSELLVNARDGALLYAKDPDAPRRPASLTKMMTLYLAFDAIDVGRMRLSDRLPISLHAARQPASRLGLEVGKTLGVQEALRAAAVLSANDAAVVLAERLGGTEERFARMMTSTAHALGMANTRFANATGLTDRGNVTTARDIAVLARALLNQHRNEYALFGTRSITWRSRRIANHNHLLGKVRGADGIKTGYTADAGYNLAASARRGNRRIIAVVLGEGSIAARDLRAANLIELGFSLPTGQMALHASGVRSKHRA